MFKVDDLSRAISNNICQQQSHVYSKTYVIMQFNTSALCNRESHAIVAIADSHACGRHAIVLTGDADLRRRVRAASVNGKLLIFLHLSLLIFTFAFATI